MEKRWNLKQIKKEDADLLAKETGCSAFLAGLLIGCGIKTPKAAEAFLHPEKVPYGDPLQMNGMKQAVGRILRAIEEGEKITIYGDYDADGMDATVILLTAFRAFGADVDYYIPDRINEGYGLHNDALDKIAANGTDLIVTVDCGITSVKEAEHISGKMDMVITDHHLPGSELPRAAALVDLHQAGEVYPFHDYCGAGVAEKLVEALIAAGADIVDPSNILEPEGFLPRSDDEIDASLEKLIYGLKQLAAVATIADIVPLIGENRRLVTEGLRAINEHPVPGIAALIASANTKARFVTSETIGFMAGPRLNAAGRIGSAHMGTSLLLSRDQQTAEPLAAKLSELNTKRQAIEHHIFAEAEEIIRSQPMHKVIIVGQKGWHPGVIGIVASRIVEKYYRPVIVLSISEDGSQASGSCRSIKGFDMHDALESAKGLLKHFGGHSMAAGLALDTCDMAAFQRAMDDYAKNHLKPDDYIPEIDIAAEIMPSDITEQMIGEMELLEPCGEGNPKPLFGARNVRLSYAKAIGSDGQHMKGLLTTDSNSVDVLSWNGASFVPLVNASNIDIAYVPSINEWQGRRKVQCVAEALTTPAQGRIFPNRDLLASIYRFLHRQQTECGTIAGDIVEIAGHFVAQGGNVSVFTMEKAINIFLELGLLNRTSEGYRMVHVEGRMNLSDSETYRLGSNN